MGFTINYRSTREVARLEADAIQQAAHTACLGRTWLGCEPVHFFLTEDGYLLGGSKPNLDPHPDDVRSAREQDLPDGTTKDMLDVLCALSRDYHIDWALSHDHDPAIGFIRNGICDEQARAGIEIFDDLGGILGEMGLDDFLP